MLWNISSTIQKPSHRVAFGPAHHLPVVEPLGSEHLVEAAEGELSLAEDSWDASGSESAQTPLEAPLMLLLRAELSSSHRAHHRPPALPPGLGMTRWAGYAGTLNYRLTPVKLTDGKKGVSRPYNKSKWKQSTFINVLYHTRFNCIPLQILSTKCNRIYCLYLIIIYPSRPYEYQRLYSWETLQYKMVLK